MFFPPYENRAISHAYTLFSTLKYPGHYLFFLAKGGKQLETGSLIVLCSIIGTLPIFFSVRGVYY